MMILISTNFTTICLVIFIVIFQDFLYQHPKFHFNQFHLAIILQKLLAIMVLLGFIIEMSINFYDSNITITDLNFI